MTARASPSSPARPWRGRRRPGSFRCLAPSAQRRCTPLLVRKTLASAVAAKLGEVTLWCSPDTSHAFFENCRVDFKARLATQVPGDHRCSACSAPSGAARGPFCLSAPIARRSRLRIFVNARPRFGRGLDAVFLPAEDGGYVLIGLQRPIASLFVGDRMGHRARYGGDARSSARRRAEMVGARPSLGCRPAGRCGAAPGA